MDDVLLAYLRHAKSYYRGSSEVDNLKLVIAPISDLYGSTLACKLVVAEYKTTRHGG